MSEISLREYLAKLEGLLNANAADEVIHHGRHILQFSPKNVAAYRLLGRALLFNQRWDEAGAALRRVLTILPTDFTAHLGMSEVYDRAKQGDEAIWHLERAFEQSPNSREVIDSLRTLYRRYRQIDPKIQLTSAAIARQYLNNAQYDQAIEVLRAALSRSPERIELKLMLAQSLWGSGKPEDGAEIALDVLEVLPDCLEANVILTQLWLDEERPSDAQRYLNRIESVDPYRALELAQGDAPEDAFQLEELDYQRFAKTQLASARPDWMSGISADISTDAEDLTDAKWSTWMSGMVPSQKQETSAAENFEENPFADSSALSPLEQPDFSIFEDQEDTPFNANANPDNDPMAWLRGSGVEIYEEESDTPQFEDFDFPSSDQEESPTAWMDAGFGKDVVVNADGVSDEELPSWIPDDSSRPDAFIPSLSEGDSAEQADLSWMQDDAQALLDEAMGVEQLTNPDAEFPDFEFFDDANNVENAQPASSFAEFEDAFGSTGTVEAPSELDTPETPTVPDWLSAYQETSPEAPAEADIFSNLEASAEQSVSVPSLADFTFETPDNAASTPQREGLTGLLKNANLDWLNAAVSSTDTNEPKFDGHNSDFVQEVEADDEWMASFGVTPAEKADENATPDWLSSLDNSSQSAEESLFTTDISSAENEALANDGLFTGAPQNNMEFDMPSNDDFDLPSDEDFDWLTSESSDEGDPFASIEDTSSSKPVLPNESVQIDAEAAPDWLSSFNTEESPEGEVNFNFEAQAEETEFNFEQPTHDDLASLFGEGVSAAEDAVENIAADAPDWLSELKPAELDEPESEATFNFEAQAEESEFNFEQPTDDDLASLFGEGVSAAEDAVENIAADAPDWLSELKPAELDEPEGEANFNFEVQEPEFNFEQSAGEDDFASLFNSGVETFEGEVEDAVEGAVENISADAPDWLSELKPIELDQPESEATFNFEAQAEAPEFNFEQSTGEDDFASLFNSGVETVEGAAEDAIENMTADAPDWLSELKPAELDQPEGEATFNFEARAEETEFNFEQSVGEDDFASLFNSGVETVEGAAEDAIENITADAPDWLSELKPAELDQPEGEATFNFEARAEETEFNFEQSVGEDDFASLFNSGVETAEDAVENIAADAPDWLSELKPAELDQPEGEVNFNFEAQAEETEFNFEQSAGEDDFASLFGEGVSAAEDAVEEADEEFATLFGVATSDDNSGDLFSGISDEIAANLHEGSGKFSEISDDIAQNFGNEFDVSGDAVAVDMPDWLTEMQPQESASSEETLDFEDDEALFSYETDAITDDLFASMSAESEQSEEESMNNFDFSNADDDDFNFEESDLNETDDSMSESSEFEWMAEEDLEASAMDSEGSTAAASPPSVIPEWDGEEIPAEAQIEDPLFGSLLNDQIFEPSDTLEEVENVMPIEPILDDSTSDEPENENRPEWVSETEQAAEEMVAEGNVTGTSEFIEEEIVAAENAAIEHGFEDYAIENEFIEGDFEEAATSNAPDWLNAMVPGIDIDFEAEEDEQVESEFIEEPVTLAPDTHHTSRRDSGFGWLVEMVEEEELASEAPVASPEPSTNEPSRFSFSRKPSWLNFSRQPSWLASKPETPAATTQADDHADFFDDDFPDWPADDDADKDEPEWLK